MFCRKAVGIFITGSTCSSGGGFSPGFVHLCRMHRNLHFYNLGSAVAGRLISLNGLWCPSTDLASAKFSNSNHVLWQYHSDMHGLHDIDPKQDKDTSKHTGDHHIELKPSKFMQHRIRAPVFPQPPGKNARKKSDREDLKTSDDRDSDNKNISMINGESLSGPVLSNNTKKGTFSQAHHQSEDEQYNYGLPGLGKKPPKSKKVKSFQKTSKRKINGELLFGLFPVLLALQQQRRKCHTLYIKKNLTINPKPLVVEIMELAERSGTAVIPCHMRQLDEYSQFRPHQGVCMDVSQLMYMPFEHDDVRLSTGGHQIEETSNQVWVVLDSVQDPMNFGAVLRSAYILGVDKVLATSKNSCALSPVVSKASAGALELMPVYAVENIVEFLLSQRQHGWNIVGTVGGDTNQATKDHRHLLLHHLTVTSNTIMLLGNEGAGLSPELLNLCNSVVTISPGLHCLNPRLDSLNVSVATGIILHHLMTQRFQNSS